MSAMDPTIPRTHPAAALGVARVRAEVHDVQAPVALGGVYAGAEPRRVEPGPAALDDPHDGELCAPPPAPVPEDGERALPGRLLAALDGDGPDDDAVLGLELAGRDAELGAPGLHPGARGRDAEDSGVGLGGLGGGEDGGVPHLPAHDAHVLLGAGDVRAGAADR